MYADSQSADMRIAIFDMYIEYCSRTTCYPPVTGRVAGAADDTRGQGESFYECVDYVEGIKQPEVSLLVS